MQHKPNDGAALVSRTQQPSGHAWLIFSAMIVLATPFWQQRWWPITDVSWLVTVCERMLAGERLYIDVIEANPPFSIWLYMPPVALAQALPLTAETAVFLWVLLLVGLGISLTAYLILKSGLLAPVHLKLLFPGVLTLLLLWPANAFGEREHMATALFLPMLVLAAWRASDSAHSKPPVALAIAVGLCASSLLLVKPYYAITPFALSVYLVWRKQDLRFLFTTENIMIGLVCVAYLISVWYLHPEFLKVIYPILQDTYIQQTRHGLVLLVYLPAFALIALAIKLLFTKTVAPRLLEVLLIAAASACLPLIYQGKGWSYHAYPAITFVFIALMLLVLTPVRRQSFSLQRSLLLLIVALGAVFSWRPFYATERPPSELLREIETALPNARRVAVLGTGIATGNNINRLIGGEWIGLHCSDWLGGTAISLADQARSVGDEAAAAKYDAMAADYRDTKLGELLSAQPNLVLVQRFDPVWSPYWKADEGFQTFLQNYRVIAETDIVTAYVLKDQE